MCLVHDQSQLLQLFELLIVQYSRSMSNMALECYTTKHADPVVPRYIRRAAYNLQLLRNLRASNKSLLRRAHFQSLHLSQFAEP